jgi:hypothetical protein
MLNLNNMCKEAVAAYFNALKSIVLGETRKTTKNTTHILTKKKVG